MFGRGAPSVSFIPFHTESPDSSAEIPENMLSRAAASSSRHQATRAGHENVCCCHSAAQAVRSGGTQARPAFSFMTVCTCCLYTPGSPRRARREGRCCGQLVRLESRDQLRHTPPAAAPRVHLSRLRSSLFYRSGILRAKGKSYSPLRLRMDRTRRYEPSKPVR